MKHYIEIKLLHNPEIEFEFLWKKVFTQVHLALVESSKGSVGISFPKYGDTSFPLGDTLRLFASSQKELEALKIGQWLDRLQDYITVTEIREVPENVKGYAKFIRKQVKTGKERQARRYAKRHDVTYEEALKRYADMEEKTLPLPFIVLQSLSTDQEMKLFVERVMINDDISGDFNSYGLSKGGVVPIF